MNAFIIELENRPGTIADVAEAIAAKGINITSLAGVTCGGSGSVALLTNDEEGTRRALGTANVSYREIEVVPASLEDRPGSFAETARRLADAGVNIEATLPTGTSGNRVSVAFATSDAAKARNVIGQHAGAIA